MIINVFVYTKMETILLVDQDLNNNLVVYRKKEFW